MVHTVYYIILDERLMLPDYGQSHIYRQMSYVGGTGHPCRVTLRDAREKLVPSWLSFRNVGPVHWPYVAGCLSGTSQAGTRRDATGHAGRSRVSSSLRCYGNYLLTSLNYLSWVSRRGRPLRWVRGQQRLFVYLSVFFSHWRYVVRRDLSFACDGLGR